MDKTGKTRDIRAALNVVPHSFDVDLLLSNLTPSRIDLAALTDAMVNYGTNRMIAAFRLGDAAVFMESIRAAVELQHKIETRRRRSTDRL